MKPELEFDPGRKADLSIRSFISHTPYLEITSSFLARFPNQEPMDRTTSTLRHTVLHEAGVKGGLDRVPV